LRTIFPRDPNESATPQLKHFVNLLANFNKMFDFRDFKINYKIEEILLVMSEERLHYVTGGNYCGGCYSPNDNTYMWLTREELEKSREINQGFNDLWVIEKGFKISILPKQEKYLANLLDDFIGYGKCEYFESGLKDIKMQLSIEDTSLYAGFSINMPNENTILYNEKYKFLRNALLTGIKQYTNLPSYMHK
jgi:hypothetical protein